MCWKTRFIIFARLYATIGLAGRMDARIKSGQGEF
jgi:hypothetical protein